MKRVTERTRAVFTRRALLLMAGQVGVLGGLGAKLYQMQVREGAKYTTLANENRISARMTAPLRGLIKDRFGVVLAGDRTNWRAVLVAEQTKDVRRTLEAFSTLVPLTDYDMARIDRDLRRHRRFIPVLVREFLTWDQMATIEVNAPNLPGIVVDAGSTRFYPFLGKLAHVVGYVAPPNQKEVAKEPLLALPGIRIGRAGVEEYRELALRGEAGSVQLEVNALGRVVRELDRTPGVPGENVDLTIDAGLQEAALAALGDQSASTVVMDCRNGEVLAMASNPSFDPSLFNSGVSETQWKAWITDERKPLINKATRGVYAPGSTFKMAVAIAGLTARAITAETMINCPGYLDLGGTRFHCWRRGGHGLLNLRGGLKNSCDVFFYETARRTGIDNIAHAAHRLGLGVKLDLDLPGQLTGLIPTREWRQRQGHPWEIGDTVVAGIGQGYVAVTPLQLATYVSRVASGRAVQPHLTRRVGGAMQPGADPSDWPALDVPQGFLNDVRGGMWAVVNEKGGTAPLARLADPNVQLAGKTGSAQVMRVSRALRASGHFHSSKLPWKLRPHALFVAFAPYDAPRYALSVVVEHGNAGAEMAAPIAKQIMTVALQRDPANRVSAPPNQVAEVTKP